VTEQPMEPERLTIRLTGRAPMRIVETDWPIIGHGEYLDYEGEFVSQSNRTTRINIRVRQHADGRVIVHGDYEYDTRWVKERDRVCYAGELVEPGGDIVEAVRRVGGELAMLSGNADAVRDAVIECINDLPPQDLS
jgi:hypothetical protein